MSHRASDAELVRYREEGFFVRERVVSDRELAPLREAVESVHRSVVREAGGQGAAPVEPIDDKRYQKLLDSTVKWEWRAGVAEIRSMEPYHHLDPRLESLIDDPRLWEPAASAIGTREVSLFSDKLNFKRPGGAPFPWHQEGLYWENGAEDLESLVSTLTYLDESTKENGCLWVIPGSHKSGNLQGLKDRGVLGALYTAVDLIDGEAVPTELPAGSVLYFHRDLVHGSQSNRSDHSRRVFVVAYQSSGLHRWRIDRKREVRVA